ncbi:hypothetical protein QFC21_003936 [Naganishia friedmannii]|uniref:Uncharacterized protein n=1 Tax=Naganishia friedmannii TaxID=89922 RepID=A0ACC2VMB7_9TREE|nr:hypothetical protein QFC21_003936 [Naganishia friedmannii]
MEGLSVDGHLGEGSGSLTNRMDRFNNRDSDVEDLPSSPPKATSSKPKSSDKAARTPPSAMQQTETFSRPQTWKDKPGMAKKRKTTKKRQYWEMIEVDDDHHDASSDEGEFGLRNGLIGTQGKSSEVNGSKRVPISYVYSSDPESASAVETDEEDYGESSKSARTKAKGKGKGTAKQTQEVVALPLSQSQKGKEKQQKKKRKKKKGKTGDGKEQSQEAEIKDLSLSSMENQVWTIDGILSAEYKFDEATRRKCWLYTIKWHGYTIAQTADEAPIPAEYFGDGKIIEDFWKGVGSGLDMSSPAKTENGSTVLEPRGRTGDRFVASPRTLVKWHISAYRKYKEESLRFVQRLNGLEKRLENGAGLNKRTVKQLGILKKGKEELKAHISDTRREIDINERAIRAAGSPFELEDVMDDISESDIDTDYALGIAASTDEDDRGHPPPRVRNPSPEKFKRKAQVVSSESEDELVAPVRPVLKPKVKLKVAQEAPSGIKLKLPKVSRPLEDKLPKESDRAPLPVKSPGQTRPKLPDARPLKPSSPVKEQPKQDPPSVTPKQPGQPGDRSGNDLRPKPRKRTKAIDSDSQRTALGQISVRSIIEARNPPPKVSKPAPSTVPSSRPEESAPSAPAKQAEIPDSEPLEPAPLFLEEPEAVQSSRRRGQWAFGADTPSPAAARIDKDRVGNTENVNATPVDAASSRPAQNGTQTDTPTQSNTHQSSEAFRLESNAASNRSRTPPPPAVVPFVKPEPQSPGDHNSSGSEGEVEHDLGLDAELNYPGVPEPIVARHDHRPRPPPETAGTTFHLRFNAPHIGQKNVGKVKLENISDPQNLGDPLAMFESLFLGGEKELVITQVITDPSRFLGGQKVNQFARVRPENAESIREINKLTLLFQSTRQPVGVVRVRSDLLVLVYSSKSIPSSMLNTPRTIQGSGGFTIAAVFPNKDLNMQVNPGVRPPSALPPPSLAIPTQYSGPVQPHSAGTSAQPTSARMVPPLTAPLTGQTTPGLASGFGRSLLGSVSTLPGLSRGIVPASIADTGVSVDQRLPSVLNKDDEVDLGLDMDMDADIEVEKTLPLDSNGDNEVDLGLDMDMDVDMDMDASLEADNDPDSKQTLTTSMPTALPALPVKSTEAANHAPLLRGASTTAEGTPRPDVTALIQTPSSPEGPVHSPVQQREIPPIHQPPRESHTQIVSPKPAPVAMHIPTQQSIVQPSTLQPTTLRSPSPPLPTEGTATVPETVPSPGAIDIATVTMAQATSPQPKMTEKASTPPAREPSPPAASEESMEEIEVQAPKITERAPTSPVNEFPPVTSEGTIEELDVQPTKTIEKAPTPPIGRRLAPPITSEESMEEIDVPATLPVSSLPLLPEKTQHHGTPVTPLTEKTAGAQSEGVMVAEEELDSLLNHPMQEDTIVLNAPSRPRTPEQAEIVPVDSVDIDMNQSDEVARPVSPPRRNVSSPAKAVHSLPTPPPPTTIMPGPPASPGPPAPPSPPVLPGPAPPSESPPPLPDSSLSQEIPDPTSATKSPIPRSRAISPINSLPTTPPVPPGDGKLKLEVVIDQTDFENSKDGYFRRLTAGHNPDDIHPNPLLATFGFTKSFGNHLLNKRCVITTNFAKDELKQLVLDSGGTIIPFNYGAEFDVMLVSNDFYPTLAEAQGQGEVSFVHADIWSFGAADFLDAKEWKLRQRIPNRSGLVSFTSASIIKAPELFLECLRKIHRLRYWDAFLSAETIQALHHFIKAPITPQTNKIKMFRSMNDATGLFKVRYPRTTDIDDPILREQRQMVMRRIDKFNRWVDVQQEISKNEHLMKKAGTLCAQFVDKIQPASHRKYWEREAEILDELLEHHYKTDEIYAMKRSIFIGFNSSAIRKGLGKDALSEFGFQDIETYEMEDLLKKLSSDGKFAGLLRPSEGRNGQDSE